MSWRGLSNIGDSGVGFVLEYLGYGCLAMPLSCRQPGVNILFLVGVSGAALLGDGRYGVC